MLDHVADLFIEGDVGSGVADPPLSEPQTDRKDKNRSNAMHWLYRPR
jgi:hypothetical protein